MGPIESFPTRQLRTTMDVVCNEWIEFFHGGLHLQVTHHLFPRIPRHNLRRASKLVKEYCREQGLEYAEHSFTEGCVGCLTFMLCAMCNINDGHVPFFTETGKSWAFCAMWRIR